MVVTRLAIVGSLGIAIRGNEVTDTILVTCRTITGTNLQLVNLLELAHKLFTAHVPCGTYRPEDSIFVAPNEFRAFIVTQAGREVITVFQGVVPLCKERQQVATRSAATDGGREVRRSRLVTDTGRRILHIGIQIITSLVKAVVGAIEELETSHS